MAIIRLSEPVPLGRGKASIESLIPIVGVLRLPPFRHRVKLQDFAAIILQRRSRRDFKPLAMQELANTLWLAQGACDSQQIAHGPMPSPGGLHALRIAVLNVPGHERHAFVYLSSAHALGLLPEGGVARKICRSFSTVLPMGKGTFFWLLGDYPRMAVRYRNPESLMWREAGVLTAALCLAAESLSLNCCAVGRHGDREIHLLGASLAKYLPLGGCIIGKR